jgi:hypothetical protein
MTATEYETALKRGFRCGYSLAKAIHDAGGDVDMNRLTGMSLMDFITTIAAPNGIQFVYREEVAKDR